MTMTSAISATIPNTFSPSRVVKHIVAPYPIRARNRRPRPRLRQPNTLRDGRVLRTLGDAGVLRGRLAERPCRRVEWQTAAEMVILAAQGQRPVMFAEIAKRQRCTLRIRHRRQHCAA